VGLGRSDEMKQICLRDPKAGQLHSFDDSESDRVTSLRVNQNEATGIAAIRVAVRRYEAIERDDRRADVIRYQALGKSVLCQLPC
jgi:hypothetical protein